MGPFSGAGLQQLQFRAEVMATSGSYLLIAILNLWGSKVNKLLILNICVLLNLSNLQMHIISTLALPDLISVIKTKMSKMEKSYTTYTARPIAHIHAQNIDWHQACPYKLSLAQFQGPDLRFCAVKSADTNLRVPADFREALLLPASPQSFASELISQPSHATRHGYSPQIFANRHPATDTYATRLTASPSFEARSEMPQLGRLHAAAGTSSDSLARISVCNLIW